MRYLFLDTNIFIHFIDFEQIDWKSIFNPKEEITIMLAPMVIDELDKHKYNKNQKIAKRVKKLLPKLEKFIEDPTLCKYALVYIYSKPSDETFIENKLDKKDQDDNLLATIIEFAKSRDQEDKIIYITNDVGPRLKAKSLNILSYKLNEDYLLPIELDELAIKNDSLQKEINELKNRIPLVSLSFLDRKNLKSFPKTKPQFNKQQFIEKELKNEKQNHPFLTYIHPDNKVIKKYLPAFSVVSLTEEQVDSYNSELTEYYKKYELYSESLFNAYEYESNSIEIQIILNNKGNAPAIDIDVEIHFPDGFELVTKSDFPKIIQKPKLPYKPKHRYDIYSSSLNIEAFLPYRKTSIDFPNIDLNQPTIKKTNSYNVSYHVQNLKHNQIFNLKALYAKFDDIIAAKGFTLDYKLIVSNVPKVVTGQLFINFE